MSKQIRRRHSEAGFTMFEIALVSAIALTGLAVVGQLLGTTQDLSTDTRAHSLAATEHRKNLRALTDVLRSIDIRTLKGLDAGTTTAVEFQRVSGADLTDRVYEASERIEWRPSGADVWGIKYPGHLFLRSSAGDQRIAKNVPAGGFRIRQEGKTLAIDLTTYYTVGAKRTVQVTSETAVSLRN
jgi:hypothetical protein